MWAALLTRRSVAPPAVQRVCCAARRAGRLRRPVGPWRTAAMADSGRSTRSERQGLLLQGCSAAKPADPVFGSGLGKQQRASTPPPPIQRRCTCPPRPRPLAGAPNTLKRCCGASRQRPSTRTAACLTCRWSCATARPRRCASACRRISRRSALACQCCCQSCTRPQWLGVRAEHAGGCRRGGGGDAHVSSGGRAAAWWRSRCEHTPQ